MRHSNFNSFQAENTQFLKNYNIKQDVCLNFNSVNFLNIKIPK